MNVTVLWGVTGAGKSHAVHELLEDKDYYIKDPLTKWFDGYKGETIGVIDEFRGVVNISKVLQWFDVWPMNVEVKGGQVPLCIDTWYIMSNVNPIKWYQEEDHRTQEAFLRRLTTIKEFEIKYEKPTIDEEIAFIFE